ncbi:MAG: lactate utilization protein [Bacillota bacterium]|nr:lactate utilization protein [Bacillota bacterium]
MAERIQRTIDNLRKNSFDAHYFASGAEAAQWIAAQIQPGEKVGFGGSMTTRSLDLVELTKRRGGTVLQHWGDGLSPERMREIMAEALFADKYFCSANAVTEDGFILNVDGTGNRIAATVFGPRQLFIIAGINKLVADSDAAFARIREIAPVNCRRLGMDTPCANSGVCVECEVDARSCRAYMLLKRPTRFMDTKVVLIGEQLGL